ncbi:Piwi domain-containing protein [Nostoc sp. LPT]|uniref:Piwi domain-containing protein n=1 Tax=Nostoc sp. LPT TaxID=2815387 RepID=UPI001D882377|nr:Piwi domain-containing protein [Nostoc sp. LPT]MBN4001938.1 hypothetical protein [Nostoc sp. LPT]
MINLYRCIRYPRHTLVSFQGTAEDLTALRNLLPFQIKESDSEKIPFGESGYFIYIKGVNREIYEHEILKYFHQAFCPPFIEVLCFKGVIGNRPIQENWSSERLNRFLSKIIRQYFETQGYLIEYANFGYKVYRKEYQNLTFGLQAFEGISYRIKIDKNFSILLQIDIVYKFHLDDQLITQKNLLRNFANRPDVIASVKNFVTRDTDELFKLARRFIKKLDEIYELTNICSFSPEPANAHSLGMQTWIWQHHFPIELEIGSGKIVPLASHISKENYGLYMTPIIPIALMLFYPSKEVSRLGSLSNWVNIINLIKNTLRSLLGANVDVPILLKEYPLPTKENQENDIVAESEEFLRRFGNITPLSLIISPPKVTKDTTDSELQVLSYFTGKLDKSLRKLKGYTVTLSWDSLAIKSQQQYIVENALIKGLMVLGATPWRILNIAHNNNESIDDICFIGVDVNSYKKPAPIVGGVILDAYGILKGQHIVKLSSPNGDSIDSDSFNLLIRKLIEHFHAATGRRPKHIIIHRDGLIGNETSKIINCFEEDYINYDILEIKKSGSPRIRQKGNIAGTPIRDITVGSEENATAHLVNTLVFREYLSVGKSILPAPESITICRVIGNTSIKILAAQVHALSRACYSSYRRTEKLPATIVYADALVSHASLKNEQKDFGQPINSRSRLNWL